MNRRRPWSEAKRSARARSPSSISASRTRNIRSGTSRSTIVISGMTTVRGMGLRFADGAAGNEHVAMLRTHGQVLEEWLPDRPEKAQLEPVGKGEACAEDALHAQERGEEIEEFAEGEAMDEGDRTRGGPGGFFLLPSLPQLVRGEIVDAHHHAAARPADT